MISRVTHSSIWGVRGLALLQIPLVIHVWMYVTGAERWGNRALLLLALVVSVSAALIMFAALLRGSKVAVLALKHLYPFRNILLGLGVLVLLIFGFVMRPEWVYSHIAVMLVLTFLLLLRQFLSREEGKQTVPGWLGGVGVAALFAVVSVRVLALAYVPQIQITDEGWHLGWVMSYLRDGVFRDGLMYYGGHDVQRYYFPMSLWLQIVGVGLWQARLFSFIVLLLAIVVTALAAAKLYGRAAAWVCVTVMAASATLMVGARIRHDAGIAFSIGLCLSFYSLALKGNRWWLHFLAGFAAGTGWFSHYHAIGFGVALALGLYLPHYVAGIRARGLHFPVCWTVFVIGGLLGAGIVFVIQVLPDFQAFLETRQPRTPLTLGDYPSAFVGHIESVIFHSRYEFILIVSAWLLALWRRNRIDIVIALTILLCHVALGLMARVPWDHYPVALVPLYALVITRLIMFVAGHSQELFGGNRRLAWVCAALLLPGFGGSLMPPVTAVLDGVPLQRPPPPAAQWVIDHVHPDALIEGEHFYYLWLWEYRYVSPLTPNMMPARLRETLPTLETVWADIDPDVLIFDPNLNTCCILQPLVDSGFFEARGFEVAVTLPGERMPITIYAKAEAWQ